MMKFIYNELELNQVIETYFSSVEPLVLKAFPPKEKKKYLCLIPIIQVFDKKRIYTENEVNEILKQIYENDYCIIRRYLIVYEFLDRKTDGSQYWVMEESNEPLHISE